MTENLPYRPAVETEYRGVRFRSKSEAILARNFDLLGYLWAYEPKALTSGDLWKPDFWVIAPKGENGPGFWSIVLEYKPAEPTDTYKDRLWKRFAELDDFPASFLLLVGNGFDADTPKTVYFWNHEGGWDTLEGSWPMTQLEEATKYRFDLKEVA